MSPQRAGEPADGGFSLAEVMVSMAVMALFAAVFTGGLIGTFKVFNAAEAETTTQTEISNVFLSLDREVRYATGISTPGQLQGSWYVEYLIKNGTTDTCVELRLPAGGGSLQRRSWTKGGVAPAFTNRIQNVAPVVENGVAVAPFTRTVADGEQDYQRLRLYLTGDGSAASASNNPLDVTFTAGNTSSGTTSDALCTEARGINP